MNVRTDRPLVTIITPSFQQGAYIEDTILSVLCQDYTPIEHIVVDGGSTDQTINILKKYPQVHWISEPDRGFGDAVNKGLRMAQGEIIGIQNADDYYAHSAVRHAVECFATKGSNVALVHGKCTVIDSNYIKLNMRKNVQPYSLYGYLSRNHAMPQSSTFFLRQAALEVGRCDLEVDYCSEQNLFLRIVLRYGAVYISRNLSFYRRQEQQRSQNELTRTAEDYKRHIEKVLSEYDLSPILRRVARAGAHVFAAHRHEEQSWLDEARRECIDALLDYPPALLWSSFPVNVLFKNDHLFARIVKRLWRIYRNKTAQPAYPEIEDETEIIWFKREQEGIRP